MRWISYGQTLPQRWAYKKDITPAWQRWAIRVHFNFETAWIVRDDNGLVYMPDGQWAKTVDFHLGTPGRVIGLRDLVTADGREWSHEWRAAMTALIADEMELRGAL